MSNEHYLKVAVFAAKSFGPFFLKNFGKVKSIRTKGGDPKNLVTEIDEGIETRFRSLIAKKFPSHKVIGEEFGRDEIAPKDLVWIIDPVDGTTNYVHGMPFCCISIALWQGDSPLAGVVYNPILKQLFSAAKGRGSFLNGKRIKVSSTTTFAQAFTAFCWGRNTKAAAKYFPKLVKELHKIRTLGSTALEICYIGSGTLDSLISYEANVWDLAAGAIILTEAGGKITGYSGRPIGLATKSILATNGKIHNQFLAKLRKI